MDRDLIVRVSRWVHAQGWGPSWRGWENPGRDLAVTVAPCADGATVAISRKLGPYSWSTDPRVFVTSDRQAVDVLCALGVLPAGLSSMWAAAKSERITTCTCDYVADPVGAPHRAWCALNHECPGPHCAGLCYPAELDGPSREVSDPDGWGFSREQLGVEIAPDSTKPMPMAGDGFVVTGRGQR